MSEDRNLETVQREYSQAVSDLGVLVYKQGLAEEKAAKVDYEVEKLRRQIKALNNEGAKLIAAKSNAQVNLPTDAADVSSENKAEESINCDVATKDANEVR